MLRTNTCGELRKTAVENSVTLSGWVQKSRDLGGMTFIDLRDRYGITQLVFNMDVDSGLCEEARKLGREFVISITGKVVERSNKNPDLPTGDVEVTVESMTILNRSNTPPFTIEDETDGGEDLRMKYRYLDLRRGPMKRSIELRHKVLQETRKYLDGQGFLEIETPVLIKSTPEGARDFVVPSRMNPTQFYALPQSPQTFKQLLMVGGFDKYFQIVRCFRDEDLRADRQPEFTQIDCEMAFVEREDILVTFEGLVKHILKEIKGSDLPDFPIITYADAMAKYGSDKPDTRFEMTFVELNNVAQGKGFNVFDDAELVVGICARGSAEYSRKQLDALTDYVRRPQIGAKGLVYLKYNEDGTTKSSVDKFYDEAARMEICQAMDAKSGDLILILSGDLAHTQKAMSELRLEMGSQLGLRDNSSFSPLWVVDFPLLEWDEESKRFHAMHHPFTSPNPEDANKLQSDPGSVNANAYDMVINGVELGGGSIRIHQRKMQEQMFDALGFTKEEAEAQFGFLLGAFEYGAPPHGGIAFGFDRLVALIGGSETIRDYIAFPKNNAGRDVMLDAPSEISREQLDELHLNISTPS
ncbi:MAG: aspartate--tRNA ligase [Flavobacteriales bacterium]|nr:aspartate--tRNA ligase [Flavobacteriales bacterium]